MANENLLFNGIILSMVHVIVAHPVCNYIDVPHKMLVCHPSGASSDLKRETSDSNNTESVALRGRQISHLNSDSLKKPSLKYLDVSENNLEELPPDIFKDIPTLVYLNISHNLFYTLPIDLFKYTPHLLVLDLKENFLDSLDVGLFDTLENLNILDVSWNNFLGRDLNPYLFQNSRHIKYLSLAGNDMNDTPKDLLQYLDCLETLVLNACAIEDVPAFALQPNLKTVEELILSSNQISKLDDEKVFQNLENLKILNLAQNDLEHIDENVLRPLKKLKTIVMRNNKLTYLSDNLFKDMGFLENIDLSHNLITVVSVSTFLGSSLKILNLSYNRLTYLSKNFCYELSKSDVNLREFYFHQNPWQCACLKDIFNEVNGLNVLHIDDVSDYGQPVCVTSNEVKCVRNDSSNLVYTNIYDQIKSLQLNVNWDKTSI